MPKETKNSYCFYGYITFYNKSLTSYSFPRIGKLNTPIYNRKQGYPQESFRILRILLEPIYLEEVNTLTILFKVNITYKIVEVKAFIDSDIDSYTFINKTFIRKL